MRFLACQHAARVVESGGIIAYPTEGVWGLGCDPANEQAVSRLLALKQRDWRKGLILVAASVEQLGDWIGPLSATERRLLDDSWPGPVTWLVPASPAVSPLVRGIHETIAVRVSAHPVVRELCDSFGSPVISTSANRAGRGPAMTALEVRVRFSGDLDFIVPGRTGGRKKPSEIRELKSGKVIREG